MCGRSLPDGFGRAKRRAEGDLQREGWDGKLKETKEEHSAKKKDPGKDGAGADESEFFKDWGYPELAANEDKYNYKELGAGRGGFPTL